MGGQGEWFVFLNKKGKKRVFIFLSSAPFISPCAQWLSLSVLCSSGKNRRLQIKGKHGGKLKTIKVTEDKVRKDEEEKPVFCKIPTLGFSLG